MQRLAFVIFGLALGFLGVEFLVRCSGLSPEVIPLDISTEWGQFIAVDDPMLRYVPRPNSKGISSYGLRWSEISPNAAKDTKRIVVLGDSAGFGYCLNRPEKLLPIDETFSGRLQSQFNKMNKPVEVINLSVSGYDTSQEVGFLELKGLALKPDLVVILFHQNDFYGDVPSAEQDKLSLDTRLGRVVSKETIGPWKFLLRTALGRFVMQRFSLGFKDVSNYTQRSDDDRSRDAFLRLATLQKQYGFHTVVVIFPSRAFVDPKEVQPLCQSRLPYEELRKKLNKTLEPLAISLVDPLQAFKEEFLKGELYRDPCDCVHPALRENEVLAHASISSGYFDIISQ